jgi:hypothetical protein
MMALHEPEFETTRGPIGWIAAVLCWGLLLLVVVVLVGWVWGDTHAWSQPFSWVPAVALFALLVLGLLLVCFVRHRMGTILTEIMLVFLLFTGSWIVGTEWGMFRATALEPGDFVIVHWNVTWPGKKFELNDPYDYLLEKSGADVLIISEPGQFGWGEEGKSLRNGWAYSARSTNALVLSKNPLDVVRPALAADGISLLLIEMELGGRKARIWVIDMPSDPKSLRGVLFASLKEMIQAADMDPPDLIVGDLNVTRHSRALEATFPDMRNAFDEAGIGWSGTWPRRFPLWQIDQVLVAPSMRCVQYKVIDLGVGRHRLQRAVLRWRNDAPAS